MAKFLVALEGARNTEMNTCVDLRFLASPAAVEGKAWVATPPIVCLSVKASYLLEFCPQLCPRQI
jgi:hypothetical protein